MDTKLVVFVCALVTLLAVSADAARGGGASRGGHAAGHAAGHVVGRAAGHGTGVNGGSKRSRNDDPMKNPAYVPKDAAKSDDPLKSPSPAHSAPAQPPNPAQPNLAQPNLAQPNPVQPNPVNAAPKDLTHVKKPGDKFGMYGVAPMVPLLMYGSGFSPFSSRRHIYPSRSSNYWRNQAEWRSSADDDLQLTPCFQQRNWEEVHFEADIDIEMMRWCDGT